MAGVADSAVGAILEIPPTLLADIQKADRYITSLQITSKRAADAVKTHWGEIATSGLDTFIQRLADAQEKMKIVSGGKIDFNINTQPFENKLNDVSNATKKTANDVSSTVQTLAWENIDFSNMERLKLYFDTFPTQFKSIKATIESMERSFSVMTTEDPESQKLANKIQLLREYYDLRKKSEEQLNTKTTVFDQGVLNDQKTLLQQILQYQKDINAESLRQERVTKLGGTIPQEDIDRLRDYKERLDKLSESYKTLKTQIDEMSTAGQSKFNAEDVKHTLAMSREQTALEEKRGQALQMVSKYLSDIKLKAAGISSREEGIYMNEQVGVYRQMIDLIKRRGEVEAQVASQGYEKTSAQKDLLQTIQKEYDLLNASLSKVTGTYTEIDRAVSSAFDKAKTMQEAENAAKLADALQKAADAAEKKRKAEAKTEQTDLSKDRAEYKRVLTLIEQIEKAQRKVNDALASATLPSNLAQQLQSSQTAAEATLNNLYNRRAELEAKRGQELADIQQQNEVKKGAAAVAEHERAEKEKTRISRQEATDRYNEEMRQARLQNQSLTAQGKQQRMTINDAKEQRAIELAQQRQKEVDRLRQEIDKLDKTDANYQKDLDRLNQRINELLGTTQRRVSYTREEAMAMAKSASTLREYENAYKALKDAMATTNPNTKEWQEMNSQLQKTKATIDEIKKKMGEFQSQASKTSNLMNQLQGRIAAAFSIGAINGFIKKMVEVRAQFELQRVALGAIIQDRDEANKIFTQVQNMALESPFSIMQLERATKQIAAFGFEAKKLVPTMKMFADISAGLGVEIDRLVLVMGHLKARNFLEGTMVRQFTNMGFNILGELSKYYTELENKLVSVGEVQARVKKKMVSFADVEEVLKRVTSAGGMFYDMQKKQSDSLWGQMQRIKDAYDLMLNEIGQSNEGAIKGALTLIRSLINHWRALAPIIKATGTAIIWYFAVSRWSGITAAIGGVVQAFKNMTTVIWGTKAAQDALNASQKANAWGLLASLIAAAVVAIYEYATAQSRLNESMDRVRNEGIGNMYDLIYQYQKLADTVRDTNKPYEEQKKALDEIKRIYADILPAEMLEIKNIKEMSDGYERATEAIKAYSAEKIKSNLKAEIENIVGKDIQSEENDLADWMATFLDLWDELPKKMPKDTFRSIAKTMIAEISEEVKNGSLPAEKAVDELKSRMVSRLKNILPKGALDNLFEQLDGSKYGFKSTYWTDYMSELQKFKDLTDGIDIGFEGAESDNLVKVKKEYENLTQAVDDYKKAIEALRLAKEENRVKGDLSISDNGAFIMKTDQQQGYEALKNLYQAYENLQTQAKKFGVIWKATSNDINAAIESQTGQMAYFEQTNEKVFVRALSGFNQWNDRFRNDDSVKAWVERTLREAGKLDLSDVQNKILSVGSAVTFANGMQIKSLDKLRLASLNSFGDAAQAAQSVYNQLAQNEIAIQTQIMSLVKYGYTAAQAKSLAEDEFGAGMTVEEIKEMMKLYKELIPAFGGTFKDPNKKKSGKGKDPWQDRLSLFKEINTEYEKLLKNYSAEESKQRIQLSYAKAVADIFKGQGKFGDINNWLGFDKDSMIEIGQQMLDSLKISPEKRKDMEKQIAGLKAEVDVHFQEDAVKKFEKHMQEVADNFELSETFRKLGVPIELTYSLGGKPTTLADQRRELEDNYYQIFKVQKKYGDEGEKAYDKIQQDIAKKEQKNLEERAKNYIKYLTESMGERAQIEIKALQDVNKIREDETLDAFSKEQAIMQRRKKMNEELSKVDLDSLKSSDVYISVFKDLERASKEQLQYVLNKLRELQSTFKDLSPAQVKSIASEMKKIEDALADKDSVKRLGVNLRDAIKYARQRNELLREQTNIQDTINKREDSLARAQVYLNELQIKLKGIQDESSDEWQEANRRVQEQQSFVKELQEQIEELKRKLEEVTGKINDGESAWNKWRKGISNIRQGMNELKSSFDTIYEGLDSMGLVNDAFRDTYESIGDILGGLDTFLGGLESMDITKPFSIITGSIKAIGGIAQTIGAAFGIGDKKKERQIQNLTEKVETLDKAYQRLEKSIEDAYRFDDYKAGYSQMQKTLAAEKTAYEEMLALEKAKKKSDNEKVKQYEDALEDIAEKQKELQKSLIEDFGSTTDYRSAAEDFVSAWLDAFKETGDGLDALNENWQEFIQNLFIKQATMAKAGDVYKDVIDIINNAMTNGKTDFNLKEAIAQAQEAANKGNEYMNNYLKALAEVFNIKPGGSGELILSDLQKGIQNITEPQAAAIEAYLNSMRFAVFRHTEQLDTLIATIQMQYGGNAENPVVTELKGIRGVLDNIYRDLHSVVKSGVGKTYIQVG